jgi:transcriptional regulator CtsR
LFISKIVTGYQHIIVDSFGVNWYYGDNKIYGKITITILKEVSMQRFQDEIESLYDIGTLTEKKNKIKDSVVNPVLLMGHSARKSTVYNDRYLTVVLTEMGSMANRPLPI